MSATLERSPAPATPSPTDAELLRAIHELMLEQLELTRSMLRAVEFVAHTVGNAA